MNRLVYIYTALDGQEYKFYSYAQVKACAEKEGGRFRAVTEPVQQASPIPARQLARRKVAVAHKN
jgi:hypothetical protein